MVNKAEQKLTIEQKREAMEEAWLDAVLRYSHGEGEGDEARELTKAMNVRVKQDGIAAHREGNLIQMLQMVHTDPAMRAKAAAALRPDLKELPGKQGA